MGQITIDQKRLKELEKAETILLALEAGGVDNWDGYDFALEKYHATVEQEEKLEALLDDVCSILCLGVYEPSERGAGYTFTETVLEKALDYMKNANIKFMEDK